MTNKNYLCNSQKKNSKEKWQSQLSITTFKEGGFLHYNKEFGSSFYVVNQNGKAYYTYTEPEVGDDGTVNCSKPSFDFKIVGDIHTHAAYAEWAKNNVFSPGDKKDNDFKKTIGYLASPDGSLQKYYPSKGTTTLRKDLPSDPKDPDRKNKKDAASPLLRKDEPTANKTRELKQKKEAAELVRKIIDNSFLPNKK